MGFYYYDYKGNESIIVLVVFGLEYECFYVDIGINGRNLDGYVWVRCSLKRSLDDFINLFYILLL